MGSEEFSALVLGRTGGTVRGLVEALVTGNRRHLEKVDGGDSDEPRGEAGTTAIPENDPYAGKHGGEAGGAFSVLSSSQERSGASPPDPAVDFLLVKAARAALSRLDRLARSQATLNAGRGVWIVKPSGQSCGRGIVCVDSVAAVARAVAELNFKAVVQK